MSSEWTSVTVGSVCELVTKGTTPTTLGFKFEDDGVRFVKVESMTESGDFILGKLMRISTDAHQALKRSQLKVNDVLFTIAGTIGRTALVPAWLEPANTNQAVAIVRPKPQLVVPRFLRYVLANSSFTLNAVSRTVQSVQANFSLAELKGASFLLPTIAEQLKIVELLGAFDDRITLLRETSASLEAIGQAIFKSWFVDFDPVRAKMEGRAPEGMDEATAALFPDGLEESELGAVPKGWRWGTLADIATFQNGYAFKSKDWTPAGHPVVKIGDVKPGVIDLAGCSFVSPETVSGLEKFRLGRGDLLVGMTGYVGETGLVPAVEPLPYLNQRVGRMAAKAGPAGIGHVYCAVRANEFKEYAEAQSHGSAQANVSGASLMAYPMAISCGEVMNAFNGLMGVVLENILSNHEQAQTLATLRDTLLPRLISGQLRLPEVDESPFI